MQPAVLRVVVDAIPPKPPLPADGPLICPQAIDLIIAFEVGSPEVYRRKYTWPIWPGAASGVTVGIGYDLGHRSSSVILLDWAEHPQHALLATASGIIGPLARSTARQMADVAIEYNIAYEVFDQTSVLEHWRVARRVFRPDVFAQQAPCVQGALTSLVFNRGGSMTGEARREMRAIRDVCLPAFDRACVGRELRAMIRIWRGSDIERGMKRRREAEADLAEAA